MDLNFRKNATVLTSDGQQIGHIRRVVLDPKTKRVTHIVIRKGLLFHDDRLAPIQMVAEATEDTIRLNEYLGEVQSLPKFDKQQYIALGDEPFDDDETEPFPVEGFASPMYWYPPKGTTGLETTAEAASLAGADTFAESPNTAETINMSQRAVPTGSVALREGAKVTDEDGKDVGRVELILTDSGSKQATHILITKGLVNKERKLIPTFWVKDFEANEIHLAAPASILDKLQPYAG
jgi:sporulation protein YlmC with PRC-barrel domain